MQVVIGSSMAFTPPARPAMVSFARSACPTPALPLLRYVAVQCGSDVSVTATMRYQAQKTESEPGDVIYQKQKKFTAVSNSVSGDAWMNGPRGPRDNASTITRDGARQMLPPRKEPPNPQKHRKESHYSHGRLLYSTLPPSSLFLLIFLHLFLGFSCEPSTLFLLIRTWPRTRRDGKGVAVAVIFSALQSVRRLRYLVSEMCGHKRRGTSSVSRDAGSHETKGVGNPAHQVADPVARCNARTAFPLTPLAHRNCA